MGTAPSPNLSPAGKGTPCPHTSPHRHLDLGAYSTSTLSVLHCEYSYYMDGTTLEVLALEKDLGIAISKDLKVSQQCKQAYLRQVCINKRS